MDKQEELYGIVLNPTSINSALSPKSYLVSKDEVVRIVSDLYPLGFGILPVPDHNWSSTLYVSSKEVRKFIPIEQLAYCSGNIED